MIVTSQSINQSTDKHLTAYCRSSADGFLWIFSGDKIVGLWRSEQVVVEGPALACLNDDTSVPLLWLVLPEYDEEVIFPAVLHSSAYAAKKDFEALDESTQQRLQEILSRDVLQVLTTVEKEVIWEKRHYLHSCDGALPRILESAHGQFKNLTPLLLLNFLISALKNELKCLKNHCVLIGWDWASLADIYAILDYWEQLTPVQAMQLLLNQYVFV